MKIIKIKNKFFTFTLIEILIVISIITILASILLPMLNKARQKAYSILCKQNLKQLGSMYQMYFSDFNGWILPHYRDFVTWQFTSRYEFALQECGYIPYHWEGIFICPSMDKVANTIVTPVHYQDCYSVNNSACNYDYSTWQRRWCKVNEVEIPSNTFLILDGWSPLSSPGNQQTREITAGTFNTNSLAQFLIKRHSGFANFLFFDSHVEEVKDAPSGPKNSGCRWLRDQ